MRILPTLALLPLFLFQAPMVTAQTGGEACAAIAGNGERLACYDGIFRAGAAASSDLSVSFNSEQLIPARPSGRQPATMTVSCAAGNLSVAFAFAGNTMSALGNDAGITLQYDLQAARSRTLPANASNTALVIDNPAEAATFLDGLSGATNLTVRVTPVNSRSLSVRFRVVGLGDQINPVRDACL